MSDRQRIIDFIDRREWKHSWHLPQNERGFIDWYSPETLGKLTDILARDRRRAIEDAAEAQALIDIVAEMAADNDQSR